MVLRISIETVQNANVSPANLAILKTLCSLYALYGIVESSGEFALVSTITLTITIQLLALILGWLLVYKANSQW